MRTVSILSYGIGNLRSVQRAFVAAGANVVLATTPDDVSRADRLVLPGVGAFSACAQALHDHGLWEPIQAHLASDKPFLGICVGMQLMMDASEEFGDHQGFGVIPGRVQRLPDQKGQKIPMVGWKSLTQRRSFRNLDLHGPFYFVHSYAARPMTPDHVLAEYTYGQAAVPAAIGRDHKIGTQFHPEKSGAAGLSLLEGFVAT